MVAFVHLLQKWNAKINLIGRSTTPETWTRHILDSAQLFSLRPADAATWADLGSGGGFPGMVLAILARELAPELRFTLVESDARKATFLGAAAREVGVEAEIFCVRIESLPPLGADVVSARALAPLEKLLDLSHRHLASGGRAIFPKGKSHAEEVRIALETWSFNVQKYPSQTDPAAVILCVEGISRA